MFLTNQFFHQFSTTNQFLFITSIFYNLKYLLQIYSGYVDDEKNTDNAWLENIVQSFHDDGFVFEKYLTSVSCYSHLLIIEKSKITR